MEYCYSGTESLWYGSWNRHVCRKGKYTADRHSRSTRVNPSRKQRCCSPSSLWSQPQRDTFDPDSSQNLGNWLTIRHRWICMWSWTEMLLFYLPVESKDCINSASYGYRNMSARRGAQFVPIGMPTICWKTFPTKTTKILLTRNSSMLMMSSSEYLFFESECSLTSIKRSIWRLKHPVNSRHEFIFQLFRSCQRSFLSPWEFCHSPRTQSIQQL